MAAEVGDPQLMVMAKIAAQQLTRTLQEDKQVGATAGTATVNKPAVALLYAFEPEFYGLTPLPASSSLMGPVPEMVTLHVQLDSEESKAEASDTVTELAPAVGSKKSIDTLSRFGLGAQYNTKEARLGIGVHAKMVGCS